jgi:prepilin-type N-terminal cleavage/methylation domain-containing protein
MRNRRGFSIPELLVVMTIMGILVRLGFPRYSELRRQAEARAIIGDVQAVRVAAYNYNTTERQSWPAEAAAGSAARTGPAVARRIPLSPRQLHHGLGGMAWRRQQLLQRCELRLAAHRSLDRHPDTLLTSALRSAAKVGIPYLISARRPRSCSRGSATTIERSASRRAVSRRGLRPHQSATLKRTVGARGHRPRCYSSNE